MGRPMCAFGGESKPIDATIDHKPCYEWRRLVGYEPLEEGCAKLNKCGISGSI